MGKITSTSQQPSPAALRAASNPISRFILNKSTKNLKSFSIDPSILNFDF